MKLTISKEDLYKDYYVYVNHVTDLFTLIVTKKIFLQIEIHLQYKIQSILIGNYKQLYNGKCLANICECKNYCNDGKRRRRSGA